MRLLPTHRQPSLTLGTYGPVFWRQGLAVPFTDANCHAHIIGKTGSGKSNFLAWVFLSLVKAGKAVTLIDPHGDLSNLILTRLVTEGFFASPEAFTKLVYLDIPKAVRADRFLPFNVLAQPYGDDEVAGFVANACKRAWPELAHGAPTFENILKHSIMVLRANRLPLTALADLLTDTAYRTRLLSQVADPQVVRFFTKRMDAWGREAPKMKESTLNRADLLTFSRVLRSSLSSSENVLDFRRLIDSNRSCIINLHLTDDDTRRLFGCLLTVSIEQAALSRADVPPHQRQNTHHLLIDEFSQFTEQSQTSATRMLSETRKYNLFCWMAHQNWTQTDAQLQGALQNVGLEVVMKVGRHDAEYSAPILGFSVRPEQIKHTVEDEQAASRSHPTFYSLAEQWEKHVQALQKLKRGEAWMRLPNDRVVKVMTVPVPTVSVDPDLLAAVEEQYLSTYFHPAPNQTGETAVYQAVQPRIRSHPIRCAT
ncbi:type IV secretory system conjugative DNA transfer family protein [Nitrolancea hollandica]|uniref:Helicase HerA central domain-containing protein n=1 Tax=Nitrolancea hollandica Lb TaxID=1129897 RepID=I4ELA5_9BACT|nr:DUF87 domain-containing protein [Nitrolancea hollandica]CCF85467.1 hypothetical protein NITHO_500002 [Nitrolancea hollandica Lb]